MKSQLSNETKLTLLGLVLLAVIMPFDMVILEYINPHIPCRPFFEYITDFALGKWYTVPSGLLMLIGIVLWKFKKLPAKLIPVWRAITLFFFSVAGAGLFADILKRLVARPRPIEYLTHHVNGFFHWHEAMFGPNSAHFLSFPSGHTTTAFAGATVISFLLPAKYRALRMIVFSFALVLAFSRIMIQAHYASDVMAGIIIGCWGAVVARDYLAKAKWFNAVT